MKLVTLEHGTEEAGRNFMGQERCIKAIWGVIEHMVQPVATFVTRTLRPLTNEMFFFDSAYLKAVGRQVLLVSARRFPF